MSTKSLKQWCWGRHLIKSINRCMPIDFSGTLRKNANTYANISASPIDWWLYGRAT